MADIASILRLHIIAIAVMAALVFGRILTGHVALDVALLGGLDWLLINLLNRVSDVREDLANQIRGTERLAGHHRAVVLGWIALLVLSFVLGHLVAPALVPYRLAVQLVGVGYSFAIVPSPRGLVRFKDLYFFKNFMSAVLFVATVFVYPLVAADFAFAPGMTAWTVVGLGLFFVLFELTYEILYDMRDLVGDRLANIPTYPVVHGLERSAQIIDGLLAGALVALAAAFFARWIGVRELLMAAAPVLQWAFYRPRFRRGLTSAECIGLTWLGAALLGVWLVGTTLWEAAGLPANIFFPI